MYMLQINFNYPSTAMGETLVQEARTLAESINQEPGFISKIWIENPETELSGGIYIFADEQSAKDYLTKHLLRIPAMGATEVESKLFKINEVLSKITNGIP